MLVALTRDVSPRFDRCEVRIPPSTPIDVAEARREHSQYKQSLLEVGCHVISLPAAADLPDSVFVEDTAIVLDELAVIMRPGVTSRQAETTAILEFLKPYRPLQVIKGSATIDGGDVLRAGKTLYVGLSSRTNEEAVEQLTAAVSSSGYKVRAVPVREGLHLKSAVTRVADKMILVNPEWVDPSEFTNHDVIEVDPTEPSGANALRIGDHVLYPSRYRKTMALLKTRGLRVRPLDLSEILKADGGVTCASIIFHHPPEKLPQRWRRLAECGGKWSGLLSALDFLRKIKNMADEQSNSSSPGHGFGTLPVYLTGISTILGAILFLRFGYAVGNVGLIGGLTIILLGHLVTVPTALAIAEIATNRKVEGGGEYFIISRSFGKTIGGVIGVSLYLSQAVSVAFYMIAFAEAFTPLAGLFQRQFGFAFDARIVSLPATLGLLALVITRGAAFGMTALYVVVATLGAALAAFFLGSPVEGFDPTGVGLAQTVASPDAFFVVFAIVFPAFTGMTAGVGLSGDLRNPRRSLPNGTLGATLTGMIVYVFVVVKLAYSAPASLLDEDQFVMSRIALWGPMIPIGLACATISSAIGSVLVAPRTLQALGADGNFPLANLNHWLSRGVGSVNEPRNATFVTGALAIVIVLLGNVDFVARLISMFFMVTYGSLCAISFLEHFAARPSYRPSFRSRWYISLFGAVICLLVMFQMDPLFAILALLTLVGLYRLMASRRKGESDLAEMFKGVLTQLTRYTHVRLQRHAESTGRDEWRPSVIMVNERTFDRRSPLIFLRWLCHRHGFGTYLHFIEGHLNEASYNESRKVRERLVKLAKVQRSTVYMDTIVSPSMTSALAQSLQVPGVSGLSNNAVMFEFSLNDGEDVVAEIAKNCRFAAGTDMAQLVLRHSDLHFGERRSIHVWLTWNDRENANLMILLSYILLGHPDWSEAEIKVFVALPQGQLEDQRAEFMRLVREGRLPVSEMNLRFLPTDDLDAFRKVVADLSGEADLAVVGFDLEGLRQRGKDVFMNHPDLSDVLFVHTSEGITME